MKQPHYRAEWVSANNTPEGEEFDPDYLVHSFKDGFKTAEGADAYAEQMAAECDVCPDVWRTYLVTPTRYGDDLKLILVEGCEV